MKVSDVKVVMRWWDDLLYSFLDSTSIHSCWCSSLSVCSSSLLFHEPGPSSTSTSVMLRKDPSPSTNLNLTISPSILTDPTKKTSHLTELKLWLVSTPIQHSRPMPSIKLDVSSTSQALAVFGFYLTLVCLFTKPIKNKLYLPDSALLTVVGIVVGPLVANWISPWKWTSHDDESRNELTYQLTRIAIGIQVFFCGLDLPKAYVKQSWRSLCFMLGPIMIFTWLITSTLIWTIIPNLDFLEASVIGACIAPTDPVGDDLCSGVVTFSLYSAYWLRVDLLGRILT